MTLSFPREVKACRNLGWLNFYQTVASKKSQAFVLLIRRLSKTSLKTKGVVAEKELQFNFKKKNQHFLPMTSLTLIVLLLCIWFDQDNFTDYHLLRDKCIRE